MNPAPLLIAGEWRTPANRTNFQCLNPNTGEWLPETYPVSDWSDCDHALDAAVEAFWQLKSLPVATVADFLEDFAQRIADDKDRLVELAHAETSLPKVPRLADVELPRTVNQLKQAAEAARHASWTHPVIDTKAGIRSCYESLGPVIVFGPNNFPFAFNSVAGGDFAAAIAAGNPVIAKANPAHAGTTHRLAQLAYEAVVNTGAPRGLVQLLYRTSHEDGARLVSDPRTGATGYTGARHAGLTLKAAADQAGKPIYLELSSVNPVVILPGALKERGPQILDEYVTSGLMGTGQFCTNPGLVILLEGSNTDTWIDGLVARYQAAPCGTLLGKGVQASLVNGIQTLTHAGAQLLTGGHAIEGGRCAVENTILRLNGSQFLTDPNTFQTETFGNASLIVVCKSEQELGQVLMQLEGNLTGCIYSDTQGSDDPGYPVLARILASKVGRLLNDKMPTGVAVSPAMNHGGPFPSTGHPGFTAVGIPASMIRFAKLTSYDAVRESRLPWVLRNTNPTGQVWRSIDGRWTQENIG